jgi:nucleotide-binding universal stress UspA family protein
LKEAKSTRWEVVPVTSADKEIVAGYDGSPDSEQALDWAIGEARLHRVGLTVCHAWAPGQDGGTAVRAARRCGEQFLTDAMQRARAGLGYAEVRPLLAAGLPARVLCELSNSAAMVVVGSHGRDRLARALLGPVSLQVAACASGPVTVVRGHWQPVPGQAAAPVVVGMDGSGPAQAAVAFAFEEAAGRAAPLVAVCGLADTAGVLGTARQVEADFEQALAKCQPDYPEVTVQRIVRQGAPRSALLQAARDAQLLVVGARGRGGLPEMQLGSVSLAVLNHAVCPVSVIREG